MTNEVTSPETHSTWEQRERLKNTLTLQVQGAANEPVEVHLGELAEKLPKHAKRWFKQLEETDRVEVIGWTGERFLYGAAGKVRDTLKLPSELGTLDISDTSEVAAVLARADDLNITDATLLQLDHKRNYVGVYSSWRDYTDNLADETMPLTVGEESRYRVIDYEAFAYDLQFEHNAYELPNYGCAIYTNH